VLGGGGVGGVLRQGEAFVSRPGVLQVHHRFEAQAVHPHPVPKRPCSRLSGSSRKHCSNCSYSCATRRLEPSRSRSITASFEGAATAPPLSTLQLRIPLSQPQSSPPPKDRSPPPAHFTMFSVRMERCVGGVGCGRQQRRCVRRRGGWAGGKRGCAARSDGARRAHPHLRRAAVGGGLGDGHGVCVARERGRGALDGGGGARAGEGEGHRWRRRREEMGWVW
jgi:hypothetical protein